MQSTLFRRVGDTRNEHGSAGPAPSDVPAASWQKRSTSVLGRLVATVGGILVSVGQSASQSASQCVARVGGGRGQAALTTFLENCGAKSGKPLSWDCPQGDKSKSGVKPACTSHHEETNVRGTPEKASILGELPRTQYAQRGQGAAS